MAWIKQGHIEKFWNIDDIKKLSYVSPEDPSVGFDLIRPEDKEIYFPNLNIKLHKGLPECLELVDKNGCFDWLKNRSYALHEMYPGSVLPLHKDKYAFFRKTYNIEDMNSIVRIIIFLEDKQHGHILEIEKSSVESWKAGDWVAWIGTDTHLAANLGYVNRYTLQITGQFL